MKIQVVKPKSFPENLVVILPVYNEIGSLPQMCNELMAIVPKLNSKVSIHFCFVNNGSNDDSLKLLLEYDFGQQPFGILTLSRNFGYESALVAGLKYTDFDVYSLVDADGEDPVEMLPIFLEEIISGHDLVLGIRGKRHESRLTQLFRRASYKFLSKVSDDPFIPNSGNFSMFRRNVRNAVLVENMIYPFLRATLSRVGFAPKLIGHDRNPRIDGKSKHRNISLYKFAILGFMTSTTWPLRLLTYFSVSLVMLGGVEFTLDQLLAEEITMSNLYVLLSLFVLAGTSIISLYLARVYKYTIGRPLFYVDWAKSYEANGFQFSELRKNSND